MGGLWDPSGCIWGPSGKHLGSIWGVSGGGASGGPGIPRSLPEVLNGLRLRMDASLSYNPSFTKNMKTKY